MKIGLDSWSDFAHFYVMRANGGMDTCTTGTYVGWSEKKEFRFDNVCVFTLDSAETVKVVYEARFASDVFDTTFKVAIVSPNRVARGRLNLLEKKVLRDQNTKYNFFAGFFFMAALIYFFFFRVVRERLFLFFGIFVLLLGFSTSRVMALVLLEHPNYMYYFALFNAACFSAFVFFYREYFQTRKFVPKWDTFLLSITIAFLLLSIYRTIVSAFSFRVLNSILGVGITLSLGVIPFFIKDKDKQHKRLLLQAAFPLLVFIPVVGLASAIFWLTGQKATADNPYVKFFENVDIIQLAALAWLVLAFSRTLLKRFTEQREQIISHAAEKQALQLQQEQEKRQITEKLNAELENQVIERTAELNKTIVDLKNTQTQLVQSEKMASLGEMTAGIAHEIQNPLNFVNNFAEVNEELALELKEVILSKLKDDASKKNVEALLDDMTANSNKIRSHGKRAESIVRNMLHHSRSNAGEKEPTDINALIQEYGQLAYHGMRAKDKDFQTELKFTLDSRAGLWMIVPQELGRVILNLCNNAFYAVKNNTQRAPEVHILTESTEDAIVITVKDNGSGIAEKNLKRIFQPFFTTKPTGEGTGLGLSLSYDIITKGHGGKMEVHSVEQEGTTFTITLPAGA
jgi:two-component system, NtrC family, sensor kinase